MDWLKLVKMEEQWQFWIFLDKLLLKFGFYTVIYGENTQKGSKIGQISAKWEKSPTTNFVTWLYFPALYLKIKTCKPKGIFKPIYV